MAEKEGRATQKKRRSKILYEITALVVILMIASGLETFFFINSAFNRLVNKSIDKLVEEEGKTIHTGLDYLGESETKAVMGDINQYTPEQLAKMAADMQQGASSQLIKLATERLQELVKKTCRA